jgi:hypothetical protein
MASADCVRANSSGARQLLAMRRNVRQRGGMDDRQFRCLCCGRIRLRKNPQQRYCGREACQHARKNAWRRGKYAGDPDYRANQHDSTQSWLETQGGAAEYHRAYRRRRKMQDHVLSPPTSQSANSDAKTTENAVISGTYWLVPEPTANSDAVLVHLALIPECYGDPQISTR